MRQLLWMLYQVAMAAALALVGPVLLVRRGRHYLATLPGRLGRHRDTAPPGGLWLHAVSVGEVGVAATLARALPDDVPLLVTTVTPTGQAQARRAFAGRGAVTYLPFELGFAVRRFFDRFRPGALVLVEGDYWPLVLRAARRRRLPVAVVNGRIGDRSFRRMQRFRALLGPLLGAVDRFGMQTEADRQRLLTLGVAEERVVVTGNLKYEAPEPAGGGELGEILRERAAGRPILVAGSTMAGEEEAVAEAFAALGGAEKALLVLAPRHPERWDEVDRLLAGRGLAVVRRSRLAEDDGAGRPGGRPAVVLLDSLGELAALYRLAAAAFIGGTLVPTGGHNPLEPARFGVPIAVGPSMDNFRDMAAQFDAAGAWRRVADAAELAAVWGGWITGGPEARGVGERAAALVAANRGAARRTLGLLAPLLEARRSLAAGAAQPVPAPSRSPWQLVYGAALGARRRWYRRRGRHLPPPVVSVGNLHWGGAGKTPLVAAVAAHLRDAGWRVAILSRGYASRGRGVRVVRTWREGPLTGPRVAGDEPVLLAGELPGVAVVVGPDRHRDGLTALDHLEPPPDLFLLDDGFSHLRLARDVDLLVFPAADPYGGGRLPPGGRLREPLAAASRADAAILTGHGVCREAAERLARGLARHGFTGPVFAAPTLSGAPRFLDGRPLAAGSRVLLVSAIARPEGFQRAAEELGFEVAAALPFPDHHAYPEASLQRIRRRFADAGAEAVLTTAKDRVKLHGRLLDVPLAELPIRAEPEAAFWAWLDERLAEVAGREGEIRGEAGGRR